MIKERCRPRLAEDDGLVLVGENLALDVFGDGPREYNLLQVLSLVNETFGRVLVADARHVLLDDRSRIEFGGHVVAGGTDDFHAPRPCLMVGLGTDEGGEEGVVDVDDVVGIGGNHLVADDLHVARQHDEGDALAAQQLHLCGLHLGLVGVVLLDGPDVEGDVELFGDVAQVLVVGDDAGDVHLPLARLVARQQVVEAVAHAADEDGHAGSLVGEVEAEGHPVALGVERLEVLSYFVLGDAEVLQLPFDAHEEDAVLAVDVLVEVDDVACVVGDEACDLGDDARLVGAVEQQDGCGFHECLIGFVLFCGCKGTQNPKNGERKAEKVAVSRGR